MAKTRPVPETEMQQVLESILLQHHFSQQKAAQCAAIFTANSIDGVYTHGINRFPRFVQYLKDGVVEPAATPSFTGGFGGIEQWNGDRGPGPLNAVQATERAMVLAGQHGIGCVALAQTNHWMRGGYYGWLAATQGFVFVGWSNTTAIMPAWGAVDARLGNNPLVVAVPYGDEAIVLDMAQSQFSFGTMEQAVLKGETLPVLGGYNQQGVVTQNPAEVLASKRPLPIGYWKGAGLALLLDILAAILSGGLATHQITAKPAETDLSQVFIAIDLRKLAHLPAVHGAIRHIIDHYAASEPEVGRKVSYPGQRVLETRKQNRASGIPVLEEVWETVLRLKG